MIPQHHLPADIERTSLSIITAELEALGLTPPPETAAVVKRVIHTTADFDYAKNLRFTPGAVAAGVAALRAGTPIITDTNMALSGISKPALARLGGSALCLDCSIESFIILTVLHICISICFLCIDKTCLIEVYTTIFHIPSCTIMFHKTSVGKIYLTVIYRPPAAAIIAQCVVIIRIVKEGTMVYFPPAVFPVNGSLYQSVQITLQHSVPDI